MSVQDGKTALYWAVEKGLMHVTKALLDSSANTEIATKVTGAVCNLIGSWDVIFASELPILDCRPQAGIPRTAFSDYWTVYWLVKYFKLSFNYLCRRLVSGEGIVSLGIRLSRCHALYACVSATLISAVMVMCCIQCSLVKIFSVLSVFQHTLKFWYCIVLHSL